MSTTYNYSISGDTATGVLDPEQFWGELEALAVANPGYPVLEAFDIDGDDLGIVYASALSAPQEALLTGAVAAHTPVPPVATPPTIDNQVQAASPTVTDDDTLGFQPSSRWVNITSEEEYVCTDATAGAAVWKSTTGEGLPPSATDPVGVFVGGEEYYNTAMDMRMFYDASRTKWLSVAEQDLPFGSASTSAGAFYKGPGGFAFHARWGRHAEWNGTIVSLTFTQQPSVATAFSVTSGGVVIVGATLSSSAVAGHDLTMDADFSQNDALQVKNSGLLTTSNVMGWARIRWRAT